METVSFAVLGTGYMGAIYAHVLAELPQTSLLGVCDILEDKARNLARGLDLHGYSGRDVEQLLSLPGLQALVIATPEAEHTAGALAALEAGLDIYVEKPLAPTVAECRKILDAAQKHDRLVMVGHTSRFDPRFVAAHDAVARGEIGQVVHAFARRNNPSSRLARLGNRVSVAGFLGVHDYDLLLWIIGQPVRSVFARGVRRALGGMGLDDCIIALLTFADGTVAVVENGWGVPDVQGRPRNVSFELRGTQGIIEIDVTDQGFAIYTAESARFPDMWFRPQVHGLTTGMYRDAIAHFAHCVRTREQPVVDGEAGLAAVRVLAAVERSLAEGREVGIGD
jgi:UDP-N-acetylglucosamine 3-dehydrogenase